MSLLNALINIQQKVSLWRLNECAFVQKRILAYIKNKYM